MTGQGPQKPLPLSRIKRGKMKQSKLKFQSREQVEKQFQAAVAAIRRIRGFVNVDVKATVRVQDVDPNKAIVLQSKHAV